jgi:hypothetical protein
MVMELKKVGNVGTRNPIFARLKVQTDEMLRWSNLNEQQCQEVMEVYFRAADRLVRCEQFYTRLIAALDLARAEVVPEQDPRIRYIPQVADLNGETESFLYESKNFLRDILAALRVFFGKEFTEASVLYDARGKGKSELVKWSEAQFGADDHFTVMLCTEGDWVGELIRKRNAVEHPGGFSGTLHIENIASLPDGKLIEPLWYRDQNEKSWLFPDLHIALDNMLTFGEDMLVSCIAKCTPFKLIQFAEIPEAERRPDCPQRIAVVIDPGRLKNDA